MDVMNFWLVAHRSARLIRQGSISQTAWWKQPATTFFVKVTWRIFFIACLRPWYNTAAFCKNDTIQACNLLW